MLSWEGEYDEARTLLQQVVAARPADTDSLAALLNVQIRSGRPREAKALAQRGLELSASESVDWFSDRRTSWREHQMSARRSAPAGSIIVRGARAERFGLTTDNQFEVEMHPRFRAPELPLRWTRRQVLIVPLTG